MARRRREEPCTDKIRLGDFWEEFLTVSRVLYHVDKEADVYDVFEFIRVHLNGGSPYSKGLLERVDKEIEKDCGPWTKNY